MKELSRTGTHIPPSISDVTNMTGVDTNGSADFGKDNDFVGNGGPGTGGLPGIVPMLIVPPTVA